MSIKDFWFFGAAVFILAAIPFPPAVPFTFYVLRLLGAGATLFALHLSVRWAAGRIRAASDRAREELEEAITDLVRGRCAFCAEGLIVRREGAGDWRHLVPVGVATPSLVGMKCGASDIREALHRRGVAQLTNGVAEDNIAANGDLTTSEH